MATRPTVLCLIPARGGSKRIRNKALRPFAGVPLIERTVAQAKSLGFVDRIVVDTDSPKIAARAERCGAGVPFLRPKRLAGDKSQIADSTLYLLARLKKDGYTPDYVLLLQSTSPLRERADVEQCWKLMREGGADAVITVCSTHPRLYHLGARGKLILANRKAAPSSNVQQWPPAYMLNGCFCYVIKTRALLRERTFIPKSTRTVICPRWRSVDLDTKEDWVLAELLYKNRSKIEKRLKKFV